MNNHVCWDLARVESIAGSGVFEGAQTQELLEDRLACHVPMVFERCDSYGVLTNQQCADELFVKEFLEHEARSVISAIIGEPGHGKTHIVNWIRNKIGNDPKRKVVLIERVQTSLAGVVGKLIEGVDGEEFDVIRESLDKYRITYPREQVALLIMGYLTANLRTGDTYPEAWNTIDKHIGKDLRPGIEALISDGEVRKYLSAPGGPFDRIAKHLTQGSEEVDGVQRRGLQSDEFPLHKFGEMDLGGLARNVLPQARGNIDKALELINWELGKAVHAFLRAGLSVDSVEGVVREVREAHERRHPDQELVILIEDLQRTQFVEDALVKAFAPGAEGDGAVARTRLIFAATKGVYDQLEKSTRERINGPKAVVASRGFEVQENVLEYASRYLDVIRSEKASSADSFCATRREGSPCEHLEACHSSFGEHEGVGLYPFTNQVLLDLNTSALKGDDGGFHPRTFVRDVIGQRLVYAHGDLPAGEHPRADFGGRSAQKYADQMARMQREGHDRRAWHATLCYGEVDGGGSLKLDPGVIQAFALPKELGKEGAPGEPPPIPPQGQDGPSNRPPEPVVDPILKSLTAWRASEASLDGSAYDSLRNVMQKQLLSAIDWDQEGVPKLIAAAKFSSANSFHFFNSKRTRARLEFEVELPRVVQEGMEAAALEPVTRIYDLDRHFSEKTGEWLGWPDGIDESNYQAIADIQDTVQKEAIEVNLSIIGGRIVQVAIAAMGYLLKCMNEEGIPLPAALEWRDIVRAAEFSPPGAFDRLADATGSRQGDGKPSVLDLPLLAQGLEYLQMNPEAASAIEEPKGGNRSVGELLLDPVHNFKGVFVEGLERERSRRRGARDHMEKVAEGSLSTFNARDISVQIEELRTAYSRAIPVEIPRFEDLLHCLGQWSAPVGSALEDPGEELDWYRELANERSDATMKAIQLADDLCGHLESILDHITGQFTEERTNLPDVGALQERASRGIATLADSISVTTGDAS